MGKLLHFAVYNPAILSDEDFLAGFVVRNELAEGLLQTLRRLGPGDAAKHRLIIGQRGMGKTSLLRRIGLGVERDPELAARFLPLTFREEQYNVHNLHIFWCNCLDALGDYFDRCGRTADAAAVDKDAAALERSAAHADGEAAHGLFKDWCRREGKRPLLLLDNIDILFDALARQDWALRRALQERNGVVVFGAAVNPLEAAAKIDAAFYDFFQVTVLEKLSFPELLACLRRLAEQRGEDGKKVLRVLDSDQARIHTLYDFTGGNPRTLVLLYLLLELDVDGDVMGDLERLLDQVSVLYKARVEDLAPQARVVLDAVALAWNPVPIVRLTESTGLETASVSSQLDRLQKLGVVEKTALSSTTAAGYQLGERLFNIWYLMRHGPRRQRNRLRWLSEFLRQFYSPGQLSAAARDYTARPCRGSLSKGLFSLALRDAVDEQEPWLRRLLGHYGTRELENHAAAARTELQSIVDLTDLDSGTHEMSELQRMVLNCRRDWGDSSAEEFWELLGGSFRLTVNEKQAVAKQLPELSVAELQKLLANLRDEVAEFDSRYELPEALGQLRTALRDGLLCGISDLTGVVAALHHGYDPRTLLIAVDNSVVADIEKLTAVDLEFSLHRLDEIFRDSVQWQPNQWLWNSYALLLLFAGNFSAAELALRKSLEIDPSHAGILNNLGHVLHYGLQRYEEAEQAYRKAIELDSNYATPWNNSGNLLRDYLRRYEEAEQTYRKAIELDPKDAYSWCNLGNLLQGHLGRYEEAEQAYRKAIKLDPKYADPWNGLGNLLQDHLEQSEEAEQAYRKCLELEPDEVYATANLAYLLLTDPSRQQEAEEIYQNALKSLPPHGGALLRAYRALAQDNFGAATSALNEALDSGAGDLFINYYDDVLRVLRLAGERGYGEKLLEWFDAGGLSDRYWPLRAAFDAFIHGETTLRDVNPEVRAAAARIYAWLDGRRSRGKPAAKTAAKGRRRR